MLDIREELDFWIVLPAFAAEFIRKRVPDFYRCTIEDQEKPGLPHMSLENSFWGSAAEDVWDFLHEMHLDTAPLYIDGLGPDIAEWSDEQWEEVQDAFSSDYSQDEYNLFLDFVMVIDHYQLSYVTEEWSWDRRKYETKIHHCPIVGVW